MFIVYVTYVIGALSECLRDMPRIFLWMLRDVLGTLAFHILHCNLRHRFIITCDGG